MQDVFAACFFWNKNADFADYFKPFHWNSTDFIVINHGEPEISEKLLENSLDIGCQAFFVTTSVILHFLKIHSRIQRWSVQRNAVKFLIVLPEFRERQNLIDEILSHLTMESEKF